MPRSAGLDRALTEAMRKVEASLNLIMDFVEVKDMKALDTATAVLRSSWEDIAAGEAQENGRENEAKENEATTKHRNCCHKEEQKEFEATRQKYGRI